VPSGSPQDVTAIRLAADKSIKVIWAEPLLYLQNGPIVEYQVEFQVIEDTAADPVDVCNSRPFDALRTTSKALILTDMNPVLAYNVRVRARTSASNIFGPPSACVYLVRVLLNETTTATPTSIAISASSSSNSSPVILIGAVVGGVVFLVIIIILIVLIRRRNSPSHRATSAINALYGDASKFIGTRALTVSFLPVIHRLSLCRFVTTFTWKRRWTSC
jgi:hypothetical protein